MSLPPVVQSTGDPALFDVEEEPPILDVERHARLGMGREHREPALVLADELGMRAQLVVALVELCAKVVADRDAVRALPVLRLWRLVAQDDLLVDLELEKLDSWEFALSPLLDRDLSVYNAIDAKVSLVNTLIRLQNQRDRFLNLSKREQADNNWKNALAQFAGINPEDLPDDDDEDED